MEPALLPIRTPVSAALLSAVADLETTERGVRPHRLSAWARQFADPQLLAMQAQPSGVRLRFETEAREVELIVHSARTSHLGAERPRGAIDVYVDDELLLRDTLTGGDTTEVDLATGSARQVSGPEHRLSFGGWAAGRHRVEVWLPHNESVELIDVRSDAELHPIADRLPVWLHHGSSISHGSNTDGPSNTWPAVAARASGVDLHNLGFGGSALLDPFVARQIRDTVADVISLKLGINMVNLDGMRVRTFVPAVHGFLDTIREGHPQTPLLLVSPIFCGIHEDTPGPGAFDPTSFGTGQIRFLATGNPGEVAAGKLTLSVIRRELAAIVAHRADPHLHYLDGLSLYGPDDADAMPLPDALHPGPAAHAVIGQRFASLALVRAVRSL